MTVLQVSRAPLPGIDPSFVWERQMRPAVDAIATPGVGPTRAMVVGNAGSGKSTVLRHLHRRLAEHDREASLMTGGEADVARVPRSHVLLVDDLHLMDAEQLEHVRIRSDDPESALVVTSRPWPHSDALTTITRQLERTRPALVLGHVSRSDILTYLTSRGQLIPNACVDHILSATGGVSWLVSEALMAHDERDCLDDDAHAELAGALQERIAHRLDTLDSELRRTIEVLCVATGQARPSLGTPEHGDDSIMQGYAEGLLMRNGQPVPLVRATVRATIPVHRLIDVSSGLAEVIARSADTGDPGEHTWVGLIHDPEVGAALVRHGDAMLAAHPRRATELYRAAIESGVDQASVTARQALAAWAANDLDAAGVLIEAAPPAAHDIDGDRLADVAAATWAARGMLEQSAAVYRAAPPEAPESTVRAMIAEFGVGACADTALDVQDAEAEATRAPSALGISMQLLRRGLAASIAADGSQTMLIDLVRAAEMYTSARTSMPIPELPAVIAATVAINLGDLATAHSVIDDAISGGHGGAWARTRLLLWRAWIAVQQARPTEARESLARALECAPTTSPRDALLARAVQVAIARRYEDAAGLQAAWRQARPSILRTEIDLYLLLPLTELVCSAAKVGDTERIVPHFARGLQILDALGSPALWSTHLRWAGIQQGILLSRPDDLAPHAHALVSAAPTSRIAAIMAKAGRVWTSVLAGSVDADAIETSARGLATTGLAWDAARLAGHGAGRTSDRKVAARLLACARELHPIDAARQPAASGTETSASPPSTAATEVLSERELEVAKLVLQGKTYAEIGETIFISPRTAEHHIAHIRRRLGASSRSDVIAKLRVLIHESAAAEDVLPIDGGSTGGPP